MSTENGCENTTTADGVKEHYSKRVKKGADVKSSPCSLATKVPAHVEEAISLVHDDVINRAYGCGLVIPECLESCRILDLGCGAGKDCYTLSKLVGEDGHVTGVDMTPDQLNIAKKYLDYHKDKFGYKSTNIDFCEGYIEDLKGAGVPENSYDVIVSNCVINMTENKRASFQAAYNALKCGGEMYFSDLYVDRILVNKQKDNKALWGEGLTGALYWRDLFTLADEIGFCAPRLFQARRYRVNGQDSVYDYNLDGAQYIAVTYRLFKLGKTASQQRGPAEATYDGGIAGNTCQLKFDQNNIFHTNEPRIVDDDLGNILTQSRLTKYFTLSKYQNNINPYDLADKQGNPIDVTFGKSVTEDGEEFFTSVGDE